MSESWVGGRWASDHVRVDTESRVVIYSPGSGLVPLGIAPSSHLSLRPYPVKEMVKAVVLGAAGRCFFFCDLI